MTNGERDSFFNTGSLVALVFASLVWKGPTLKVRSLHAAILFGAFLLVRFAYQQFSKRWAQHVASESEE